MSGTAGVKLGGLAVATLVIGLAACGGDDGEKSKARAVATAEARPLAADLDRFLMRKNEEPGYRPGALPGAMPRSRATITGLDAFAKEMHLAPADVRRLRS